MSGKPGRNDPCPCGSGRKYKKCHFFEDEEAHSSRRDADRLASLGADVTIAIFEHASERFAVGWDDEAFGLFVEPEDAFGLLIPYAAHHLAIGGHTAAQWYRAEREAELSPDERACLDAEAQAWISIWQVVEARPGEGLRLRDRLSDETRDTIERTASRILKAGQNVLARIVDLEGFTSINGLYPYALEEPEAAEVELVVREELRCEGRVPVERLREPETEQLLIVSFDEENEVARHGPTLVNRDGEAVVFTTDHFTLEPGSREAVERELRALRGTHAAETDEAESTSFVFSEVDVDVRGTALLDADALHVTTTGLRAADELRAEIESACNELLRHQAREHTDPAALARDIADVAQDDGLPEAEAQAVVQAFKQEHYATWADVPLPALDGRTPREAAASAQGLAEVAALLDSFEQAEASLDAGERFDFGELRRELGVPQSGE